MKIIKSLKNVSMDASTLDKLQKADVIKVLVPFLQQELASVRTASPQTEQQKQQSAVAWAELQSQTVNLIFNLCRLSRSRQEQAALVGVIPYLQQFVGSNSHLKQFALPILCEMAHASKRTRAELLKHKGIDFYLTLLSDNYWKVNPVTLVIASD